MAVDGPTFGVLQSVVNAFSVELEAARLDIVTYYYTVGPGQNQRLGDDEYTAGLLNQGGQGVTRPLWPRDSIASQPPSY